MSFGNLLIEPNSRVSKYQIGEEPLDIHWTWAKPKKRYHLTITRAKGSKIILDRANITTVGTGEDLVEENLTFPQGKYTVVLYEEGSEQPLDSLSFEISNRERRSQRFVTKDIASLTQSEKSYCSCLIQVAQQQPPDCIRTKRWGEVLDGKVCHNPELICKKHLSQPPSGDCSIYYDYTSMTDSELVTAASYQGLEIPKWNGEYLTTPQREALLVSLGELSVQ